MSFHKGLITLLISDCYLKKSRYMQEPIWNHESMIRTLAANWDDTSR